MQRRAAQGGRAVAPPCASRRYAYLWEGPVCSSCNHRRPRHNALTAPPRALLQELLRALSEPENAVLRQFSALWGMQGVELDVTEGARRAIAREARKRGTGARSLRSLLEDLLLNAQFEAAEQPGCTIVLDTPGPRRRHARCMPAIRVASCHTKRPAPVA